MVGKLGICFLAMIMGSATFLVAGVACFLTISQLQYLRPAPRRLPKRIRFQAGPRMPR